MQAQPSLKPHTRMLLNHHIKAYLNLTATMAVIPPSHTPLKH